MDGAFTSRLSACLRGALAAGLALCVPSAAFAQTAVTAGVDVLDDSRVTNTGDLDFGQVIPSGAGSITIAPDGDVTVNGAIVAMGDTSPASFNLSRRVGVDYLTYRAPTISDTVEIVHESDPSETMTVRNFTTDFNRSVIVFGFFRVPAYYFQTSYDFRVGGTLDVAEDQMAGEYSGAFTVTIDYD